MPFSDFRLMAVALVVIAGCALATTLRSFGFTRWFPPKVRRLVQKCRAKLKRKPKEVHYDNSWTFQYGEHDADPLPPTRPVPPENITLGRPRRKRRPKA
jgi:hypothetical protein